MATSKDSLQVHAARLREMAAHEASIALSYAETAPEVSQSHAARSSALLAGAAALEAVPVVRDALVCVPIDAIAAVTFDDNLPTSIKFSAAQMRALAAALAKLEAL